MVNYANEGSHAMTDIITQRALIKAIKACNGVYVQIRFGVCESWVKITKNEALFIASNIGDASPKQIEMGRFGCTQNGDLYLG